MFMFFQSKIWDFSMQLTRFMTLTLLKECESVGAG